MWEHGLIIPEIIINNIFLYRNFRFGFVNWIINKKTLTNHRASKLMIYINYLLIILPIVNYNSRLLLLLLYKIPHNNKIDVFEIHFIV